MSGNGLLFETDALGADAPSRPAKRPAWNGSQGHGGTPVRQTRRNTRLAELTMGRYDDLRGKELIGLREQRDAEGRAGIRLTYSGQTPPRQIVRRNEVPSPED